MKKILMLLLAVTMCFSLVACGKDKVEENPDVEVSGDVSTEVSGDVEVNEEEVSGEVPGDEIVEDPSEEVQDPVVNPDEPVENPTEEPEVEEPVEDPEEEWVDPMMTSTAMKTLVDTLVSKAQVMVNAPFDMKIDKEAALSDVGLDVATFEAKIADSVKYESMMMPSNKSICIVEVKAGEDVAAVKNAIFQNANPRKWICANADKVLVVDSGNYVMLVMSTEEDCTNLYNAFVDHFGAANVGAKLERLFEEGVIEPDIL